MRYDTLSTTVEILYKVETYYIFGSFNLSTTVEILYKVETLNLGLPTVISTTVEILYKVETLSRRRFLLIYNSRNSL